jgi:hypothetical protein
MPSPFVRATSRLLIACLSALSLNAHAGLIGTADAVAAVQSQVGARATLASQIEALGIAADTARERVAALTEAEVAQLRGQLDALPAGGSVPGLTVGVILVIAFLFWRFEFSDQAKAEKKASEQPAKK